jgi:hypothetical protein
MSAQALRFAGYKGEQAVHTEAAKRFGIALERELGDGFTFSLMADALAERENAGAIIHHRSGQIVWLLAGVKTRQW